MSAPAKLAFAKLGIIAGGGALPVALAAHCAASGREYYVARVAPFADAALASHPGATHDVFAFAERIESLKAAGCDALVFAGQAPRPDFSKVAITAQNAPYLQRLAGAAPAGDDALLRTLIQIHADSGFAIIGAEEACADLLAPVGALGAHAPDAAALKDINRAAFVAAQIGALDIGQGAVVCAGITLAVEAQEGTDAMLARVAELPEALRGSAQVRRGVLVKRPKPQQERRIDLPVIGASTVVGAARAGLAGIAVEAGEALVLDRAAVIAAADGAGLFVYGFTAAELGEA